MKDQVLKIDLPEASVANIDEHNIKRILNLSGLVWLVLPVQIKW